MILHLKKLQLCLDGSELASYRLEYYQTYSLLFEYPPHQLESFIDFPEDVKALSQEYLDLFVKPTSKYVSPFKITYDLNSSPPARFLTREMDGQKPNKSDDHLVGCLHQMMLLLRREKRNWQKNNYLMAMNILKQEESYLNKDLGWLSELCQVIQKNTTTRFYAEVGENFSTFLSFEKFLLKKMLQDSANVFN